MRGIGYWRDIPTPPDTIQTMIIANTSGQAMDWPSGYAGGYVRITAQSTVGVQIGCFVNLASTRASLPTSGQSTLGTSFAVPVLGSGMFQISSGSTGWSVASASSGYVVAEIWSRV